MRTCFSLLSFFLTFFLFAQPADEAAIRETLAMQQECWNKGDLECFMEGYWKSENLVFVGSRGVIYGWEQTLSNYQKSYPSKEKMGQLEFNLISLEPLSEDFWSVIGKWSLERSADSLSGHFTLIFRKFGNEWLIVQDHSS